MVAVRLINHEHISGNPEERPVRGHFDSLDVGVAVDVGEVDVGARSVWCEGKAEETLLTVGAGLVGEVEHHG